MGAAWREPEGSSPSQNAARIIAVDLDHTLIQTDSLHEQVVRLLLRHPLRIGGLLASALRGKATLKAFCSDHVNLDPALLLTCDELLSFLKAERISGTRIVLSTAADRRIARSIADHLGVFDEVIATDGTTNLRGAAKAAELERRFPQGFIYAGDHASDLAVWEKASGIILVGTNTETTRRAKALGRPIVAEFRPRSVHPSAWSVWTRALRVHHWSKNLLMFVPLLLAHQWNNIPLVLQTGVGFVLLLAATSSTYIVNDLADLDADRAHATKRQRPLASGTLPIANAIVFAGLALPVALVAACFLNLYFAAALAGYVVLTLGYSFGLKRVPLLDTFLIGVLFTTRLLMGSAMIQTALPVWLVTFSMFFFFSLATAKRHAEIVRARTKGGASLASRGYEVDDWPLTLVLGVTTGIASLVILVLYMVDEAFRVVGYSRPEFLWFVAVLIGVWIGRIWLLTHRGRMHDDPVTFALRDRPSQVIAALAGLCFVIAL